MTATLRTLWFWRKGEDGPELLTAWDEWSVDGNFEGWVEDCERHFETVASDDSGYGPREIIFKFDFSKIEEAFWPSEIEAEVLAPKEES